MLLIGKYLILSILPGCLLVSGITGIEITQMFHTFLPSSDAELHYCFWCESGSAGSAHSLRAAEKCQPAMMFYKVKASEVLM